MLRAVQVFPSKCVCIAYTSIFDPAYVGCRPYTIVNIMRVQSITYASSTPWIAHHCQPHGGTELNICAVSPMDCTPLSTPWGTDHNISIVNPMGCTPLSTPWGSHFFVCLLLNGTSALSRPLVLNKSFLALWYCVNPIGFGTQRVKYATWSHFVIE